MGESIIVRNTNIGMDRQIVTAMDQFRASEFVSDRVSGANNYTSGYNLLSVVTSNVGRIRPLNISIQNAEAAAATLVFRDGALTGTVVAGPYIVNAGQERHIEPTALRGRYFSSSIYVSVASGTFAAGIEVQVGYIIEPDDYYE